MMISMRSRVRYTDFDNGLPPPLPRHHDPDTAALMLDELKLVKYEKFDMDGYRDSECLTIAEKSIRSLCLELVRLKDASIADMCRNAFANYKAFIHASKELSNVGDEIVTMKNVLSRQAAIIQETVDGFGLDMSAESSYKPSDLSPEDPQAPVVTDTLDVLIAERRLDEALTLLLGIERDLVEGYDGHIDDSHVTEFQGLLSQRKARLAEQFVEIVQQPSISGRELRDTILALYKLDDGPRAHSLLLGFHSRQLQYDYHELKCSVPCYGGAFVSSLSKLFFSTISRAVKDSRSVFGQQPGYTSELIVWASKEIEIYVSIIEKNALLSAAKTGNLHVVGECVETAIGYCSLLESQGLSLCHELLKQLRSHVFAALEENVTHIKESITALASDDDWTVSHSSGSAATTGGLLTHLKVSSSAWRFNRLIQDLFDNTVHLMDMQLLGQVLDKSANLFEHYVGALIKALPQQFEDTGIPIVIAETEHQQLGIFANISALADEILPRAAAKFIHSTGQEDSKKHMQTKASSVSSQLRDWNRQLQHEADNVKTLVCQEYVVNIFFSEDQCRFTADMYFSLDPNANDQEPMLSSFFQDLYYKWKEIKTIAVDVLEGRERVISAFLNKFLEAVVIFISNEQDFWNSIEQGLTPLGQAGLQQLILDMYFVLLMASLTAPRGLRRIQKYVNEIIARAKESFYAIGLDPESIMPDDQWFFNTADECLQHLSGKHT